MQSPLPTLSLILTYFLFVHYAPKFMKNRPPFEMKLFLFVFNAAIVVLYVYLTREVCIMFIIHGCWSRGGAPTLSPAPPFVKASYHIRYCGSMTSILYGVLPYIVH